MKRLCLSLVLIMLSGNVSAQWTGADWNGWSVERKTRFVDGFVAGSQFVASNAIVPSNLFPNESVRAGAKALWDQAGKEFSQAAKDPQGKFPPKYNSGEVMLIMLYDGYQKNPFFERAIIAGSVQQIGERLDAIFKDPKNHKIAVPYAIYLAKKIVGGFPPEDVNVLLPYLRGEKAVPIGWIIPVYDTNGKFVKVIEFP